MLTSNAIAGMLLEEAVLHLLRHSGYKTIEEINGDSTLEPSGAGICVKGRGAKHQIDAIADFLVPQPFANPQRLLVEAKCYPRVRVSLETIRNSVGVLKDVNEFWVPAAQPGLYKKRFHYSFAIVSATAFTKDAQRYAFAQDVFLIPLQHSRYFDPILTSIEQLRNYIFPIGNPRLRADLRRLERIGLAQLRRTIRGSLRSRRQIDEIDEAPREFTQIIRGYVRACRQIDYCLLAVLGGCFPLFLVPSPGLSLDSLRNPQVVRIRWDDGGWYLSNAQGRRLFSFDLPADLFGLYAEMGLLNQGAALDMKEAFMSSFQTITVQGDRTQVINFRLDRNWLNRIRRRLE